MRRALIVLAVLLGVTACQRPPNLPPRPRLQVADVLGGDVTPGFARAFEPRELVFPRDHGPHPDFLSEWWYFTGNLRAGERLFGYQLTFFRTALAPPSARPASASGWRTSQIYMGHFAVTDVAGERFLAFDRFQRGALGLAGAEAAPWRVWLDDWELAQLGAEPFPLRLRASGGVDVELDLTVVQGKPVVLQGNQGLSQKGPTPGNASYYYSFTRLPTAGTIAIGEERYEVTGESWLDREWSTSVLEAGQVGWDWFALQLSDQTELMFYGLRGPDGNHGLRGAGTFVDAAGRARALPLDAIELSVVDSWRSPIDGTLYPSGWTVAIPELDVSLSIEPFLAAQELDLAFRYWEGAVSAFGTGVDGAPVSGTGYVELTGYAEAGRLP